MRLRRDAFLALFPDRRLFFSAVCIGGILGFYLLSIWPHQQAVQQLNLQIDDLHRQIDDQKLLAPIYKRFTEILGNTTQPTERVTLPLPHPERLQSEQIAGIEPFFRQLAEQNQLTVRQVGADLNSMIGETGELKFSLELVGPFSNLRGFLLKLGELPYLAHVERIEVRRETGLPGLHMELEIWLSRQ
jgi:hypothetical protein